MIATRRRRSSPDRTLGRRERMLAGTGCAHGPPSPWQLGSRDLRGIRGDLDAVRNAVAARLARSAPGSSQIPLRVLDFGVARRLGCAPMGTRSAIAGIPVYVISLRDCELRRRNMTGRLGAQRAIR